MARCVMMWSVVVMLVRVLRSEFLDRPTEWIRVRRLTEKRPLHIRGALIPDRGARSVTALTRWLRVAALWFHFPCAVDF